MVQNCPSGLNVRNAPSVNAMKVATLQNGAVVTAQQIQGDWIHNGLGWSMMGDGTKFFLVPVHGGGGGGGMNVAVAAPVMVSTPSSEGKMGQPHQVQNCQSGLNVRAAPAPTSQLMGSPLPNGSVVYVVNKHGFWFQHAQGWSLSQDSTRFFLIPVNVGGGGMGYGAGAVSAVASPAPQLAIPEGAKQELHTVINAQKGLNVRTGPGTEFALTGAPLANGSQVVVVQSKGNWAQHLAGWSLMQDDHGTTFLQPIVGGGGAGGGGGGGGGEEHLEGVVQCEFCHAAFKSEEDVFCSKCGKAKSKPQAAAAGGDAYPAVDKEESPPAFNPNYS